jgi:hypothetical protein
MLLLCGIGENGFSDPSGVFLEYGTFRQGTPKGKLRDHSFMGRHENRREQRLFFVEVS